MSAIATVVQRHPGWSAGIFGAFAGAATGLALGLGLALALLTAPPEVVPAQVVVPDQFYEQIQQHLVRENAVTAPSGPSIEAHELLRQHLWREYGQDAAGLTELDRQRLLREHLLREYGAP